MQDNMFDSDFLASLSEDKNTNSLPSTFRIELKKFVFQSLLEKVLSVVPTKDTIPVLKNIYIEASEGQIRVSATDLDLSIISFSPLVATQVSGAALFPAKKMIDIIRGADEGNIIVDVKGNTAVIYAGRATWELMLSNGDGYPGTPDISNSPLQEINRVKFLNALRSVRYAVAQDATRPPLMMINVSKTKMTSCDGVRFQQVSLEEDFDIKIPVGAIEDLVRFLHATDSPTASVGENSSFLIFKIGLDVFLSNKITTPFPDVEHFFLKPALENNDKFIADKQEFIEALKRVRINSDPDTSAVGLRLEKGALYIAAKDKNGNRAEECIDASWDKEVRTLAVNHKFLLDMITTHEGKSCQFFLGSDSKSKKSSIMLKDEEAGTVGILPQMITEFVWN